MHVNVVWITINKKPFVDASCCVRQFNMSFGSKNLGQNIKIAKKSQQFMCLKYIIKRITHFMVEFYFSPTNCIIPIPLPNPMSENTSCLIKNNFQP